MHHTVAKLAGKYPELSACAADIERAYELLRACYEQGGKVLICGNGGSASDSDHIVGELMKGFLSKRPLPEETRAKLGRFGAEDGAYLADRLQGALPAISLTGHSALITAFMNDVAPDMIFAQQVYGYGKPGDVLIGISTSGNAVNVKRALQVAAATGVRTVGLTGRTGGAMNGLCDVTIRVPWDSTPDIQERHLPIYHALCIMLEEHFFPA